MKKAWVVFALLVILFSLFAVPMKPQAVALAAPLAGEQTYIVLYQKNSVPADAASAIRSAGGTLVYSYDAIGVAVVRSEQAGFAASLRGNSLVQGVSATGGFGVKNIGDLKTPKNLSLPAAPVTYDDPLFPFQWDMVQIHVPEAHAVTMGDPSVLVGILDTGIDYTHPDLAPNIDFAASVGCLSGAPDPSPTAWFDDVNGHGTHVAGTVAAVKNDIGVVGIAPKVRIAAVRVGTDDGFIFPEAAICGFMWAADHHMDVVNNSYFVDPWLFNCRYDADQRAIWEASRRAIRYAMQQGVTVVAAAGNENIDLSHTAVDAISPDYPPGEAVTREVTNACAVIPAEIPGVIAVSGVGLYQFKTFYSSYGISAVDLTAPGGDWIFQNPDPTFSDPSAYPFGLVLSTVPMAWGGYGLGAGTSMASPHVTGVAALIVSRYGKMPPGKVQALLERSATPLDCPPAPFDPSGEGWALATCQGGIGHNGFYGAGEVDAYRAVTTAP